MIKDPLLRDKQHGSHILEIRKQYVPLPFTFPSLGLLLLSSKLLSTTYNILIKVARLVLPTLLMSRLAFKGWTFKSPQSRPTPPFFPEFTPSRSSSSSHHEYDHEEEMEMYKYGHGLEQDLSHLRDMSGSGSGDSNTTITPGQGTMRCRALSF
jgi:hypothetical protein